jgi:Ribbon-helix-helix protein, copG family.
MSLSIRLPKPLEERLAAYCAAQGISRSEAVKRALDSLLSEAQPTPYELGVAGFGADNTHSGDVARNSKRLLRERFRAQIDH